MNHIDHHTLELYVLKSASIAGKRRSVAHHLAVCPHCQAIADEILQIYAEADKHVQPVKEVPLGAIGFNVERVDRIATLREPQSRLLARVNRSLLQRFIPISRSHPIVSSSSLLASIAFVVFGTMTVVRLMAHTANPAEVHYDTSRDILEVYDEKENLLWHKPSRGLKELQEMESARGDQYAAIGDLDGKGQTEVVTLLPVESSDGQPTSDLIRIFDNRGSVIASKTLGHEVSFTGRTYPGLQFGAGGLALIRSSSRTGMEVVASAPHYRSPSVVARINGRGELLGEYWHFGHLYCPQPVHSTAIAGELVVLMGSNDIADSTGHKFPVIAVLDPSRISGRSEATETRGFGFTASTAEVVYLRLPRSDMDDATHAVVDVVKFIPGDGMHWSFIVTGNDNTPVSCFEYVFDSAWRIESVLSTDTNARVRARLRQKGLVRGHIDQQYLNALKDSVEYWDGQRWNNEFSLVNAGSTRH